MVEARGATHLKPEVLGFAVLMLVLRPLERLRNKLDPAFPRTPYMHHRVVHESDQSLTMEFRLGDRVRVETILTTTMILPARSRSTNNDLSVPAKTEPSQSTTRSQ